MKKSYFTINTKLLIIWLTLSVIYFGGLKIVEIYLDLYREIPKLAIMLLFLWTAPIFTLASGILAYKATSRVLISNLGTIAIMGLINVYDCFADAKEKYRIYTCTYPSADTFFGGYLLETFLALFQISLLVFIVLLIISAITKWFSDSRKSNDICQAPSSTSEQEVKKAKIASISKPSNYFIVWIALSVIYFGGLKIFEMCDDSDIPGLATVLLFIFSAPIFAVISGVLAYKATSRVIIPNLVTIAIMGLINLYDCFADARQTFFALFQISLLVFIVLLIISAMTKWGSDSRKSNDICKAPSSTSEQEVKKAKIASISKPSNYFIVWIALSINYFVGLKIFEMCDNSDIPGIATALLFIFSAPIFAVISGVLEYKATSKVILPNLLNVVVMVLVNAMDCFEEAEDSYQQAIRIGHSCTFGEKALEIFSVVLLIALPIYIISVIASAIMKWIHNRKEKKTEQANPDVSNSID